MRKKIFLFLWGIFYAGSVYGVTLNEKMDVQIGVFDAATIELNYKEDKASFNIKTKVQTANLFDSLYPFKAMYESMGRFVKRGVLPELYQTTTQTRNHLREKKVFYDEYGRAYKRLSQKDSKINEIPINNVPQSADAADLQSVFAELIYQFQKTKKCALMREIFDGKKHYRVIVEDKGIVNQYFQIKKKEVPAYFCSIFIENIKDNNDNILWDVSAEKPIKLYIGTDEEKLMPFVMEIKIDSTPLGALKVIPKQLNVN